MTSLVIFGTGEFAEIAAYYFRQDGDYSPVAFTVDRLHLKADTFAGLPVVPFEDLEGRFPPHAVDVFVAIGYSGLNRNRADKFFAAERRGYRLASYISPRSHVWQGFALGRNCFILDGNTIQPFAHVGDDTVLWSGNHIGHHAAIGAHCYIAGHVVVAGGARIGDYCFVGARATLREHIEVGDRCLIGMGALLLGDAAADGVYGAQATTRSIVPSRRAQRHL